MKYRNTKGNVVIKVTDDIKVYMLLYFDTGICCIDVVLCVAILSFTVVVILLLYCCCIASMMLLCCYSYSPCVSLCYV